MSAPWNDKLFFGDNLTILRDHIADCSVDLIYLDPPFNSKAEYGVLFKSASGEASLAQAIAFRDTWHWDQEAAATYHEIMTSGRVSDRLRRVMEALKLFLTGTADKKGNGLMAYLTMMALRLIELHRVLKATGSLYLHCDPTASHYVKLLLDAVFEFDGFQNEIVWSYRKWSASTSRFLRNHDVIFFYTKSKEHTFNVQYVELAPSTLKRFKGQRQDFADEERTRKILTDEESHGSYMPDVWPICTLAAASRERLGYPTQKPEALLERIIRASSREGDVVLDPFCGCGTTIAVAERLGRKWVGIDITYLAVDLMERRLLDMFSVGEGAASLANIPVAKRRHALKTYWQKGDDELKIGMRTGLRPYEVLGVPLDLDSARFLFQNDPFQFEWWCVAMIGAQGRERKGADKGIDGVIVYEDRPGDYKRTLVSVKGGKVQREMVATLKGDMARENASSGILISLETPTGPMRQEAASSGRWTSALHPARSFPVVQLVTVEELLAGAIPDVPRWGIGTFKSSAKIKQEGGQEEMEL